VDVFGQPADSASLERRVQRVTDTGIETIDDCVAVEEPLEILIKHSEGAGPLTVTMRTPGNDRELTVGFLLAEGIIASTSDLESVTEALVDGEFHNQIVAQLDDTIAFDRDAFRRNVLTTSACGICGRASIEQLVTRCEGRIHRTKPVSLSLVRSLPSALVTQQSTFATTGGLHAAGIFGPGGDPVVIREDIGRHNAVDKVIGFCALNDMPLTPDHLLVVSGRASYELVQKAIVSGLGALVAVGAPSTLAVDLAFEFGLMLIGFARADRCNVYTCQEEVTE
jgi:FdhD protein